MSRKVKRSIIILPLIVVFAVGCQLEWHFSIQGFDSASRPQFCISVKPKCAGEGVSLAYFEVEELVIQGASRSRRTVWQIAARTNEPLRQVTYGLTPPGWEQLTAPEPLQVGRIYEVGRYWFRLKEAGGKLSYEVAPIDQLK